MKSFTRTKTETFTPLWVKVDFSTYGDDWIRIRANLRYKGDNCFKCHKHFQMGDTIGIACFKEKGNKVLCKECAEEIQ